MNRKRVVKSGAALEEETVLYEEKINDPDYE